ncbi:MAG: hypothetical protein IPO40_18010 [Fibrobacteres bacterium]|nr:hypothetical protein [Fibrobacterota bacterium]
MTESSPPSKARKIIVAASLLGFGLLSLHMANLLARLLFLLSTGLSLPLGGGSHGAFIRGLAWNLAMSLVAAWGISWAYRNSEVFPLDDKMRGRYLMAIAVMNAVVLGISCISTQLAFARTSIQSSFPPFYPPDVKEEIHHRFGYRMAAIDSAHLNPSVEMYFQKVQGCQADPGVFSAPKEGTRKAYGRWVGYFHGLTIWPDGGSTASFGSEDLSDSIWFANPAQLGTNDWNVLMFDGTRCMVVATWSNPAKSPRQAHP